MVEKVKYKKAGNDWLLEVPTHWKVVRLKNLCCENLLYGINTQPSNYTEKGIRFLRTNDIDNNGNISDDGIYLKEEDVDERYLLKRGDLLFSRSGTIGRCYLHKSENSYSYAGFLVRFRTINFHISEWVYYYSFTYQFKQQVFSEAIESTILNFNGNKYANIKIPTPPISEQDEIVQYIKAQEEKINLFIEKKQRFIELLKEQRQSKIDEAVDGSNKKWVEKRLKFIAEIKFSNVDKHSIEDEIPVRLCNYVDVYKNDYITNDIEFMNATATETEIKKFTVSKGNVIITKDSEEATDIAVPAYVKEDLDNVVCGYHLALIIADENKILSEYLFRKFQSSKLKAYFAIEATGVTRVGLSMGEITGVRISYPKSLEEQKQIVAHIKTETTTIDKAIDKAEREIELIREYKEAMISEAVMGKGRFKSKLQLS